MRVHDVIKILKKFWRILNVLAAVNTVLQKCQSMSSALSPIFTFNILQNFFSIFITSWRFLCLWCGQLVKEAITHLGFRRQRNRRRRNQTNGKMILVIASDIRLLLLVLVLLSIAALVFPHYQFPFYHSNDSLSQI